MDDLQKRGKMNVWFQWIFYFIIYGVTVIHIIWHYMMHAVALICLFGYSVIALNLKSRRKQTKFDSMFLRLGFIGMYLLAWAVMRIMWGAVY